MYTIDKKTLISLIESHLKLAALECGGVDNWDWYGTSLTDGLDDFAKDYDLEDKVDLTFADVAEKLVDNYATYTPET